MSATLTAIPQGGLDFRSDWRISFLFGLTSAGRVEETRPILFPHPVQQLQRRRTLLFAWAHRLEVQNHTQAWPAQLRLNLFVVILGVADRLPSAVLGGDFTR